MFYSTVQIATTSIAQNYTLRRQSILPAVHQAKQSKFSSTREEDNKSKSHSLFYMW